MKIVDGWHCPDLLSGPGKYLRRAIEDTPFAIEDCAERRFAIQAGGHIGTWPVILARSFEYVTTFEPVPSNYECLIQNVAPFENIASIDAALDDTGRGVEMVISGKSTGQHVARKHDGKPGVVRSKRLDDLQLIGCDAIFLDLEGFEMYALRGAEKTIAKFRPVLMVENNKRAVSQGFTLNDVPSLLRSWGYHLKAVVHEDMIFTPGKAK